MVQEVLQLDTPRLARGGFRDIYQHPERGHLLVKVVRAAGKAEASPDRRWSGVLRRYGIYTPYVREMKEYLAAYVRFSGCPPHIQQCYGFVETNFGLGMVVEKLCGADGELAPNMAKILKAQGIDSRIWGLYEAFHEAVRKHQLIINDMHPSNVVLANEGGKERLVLVDGLGEKAFIPFRTMSASFNRLKIDRDIRYSKIRIKRYVAELYWPGQYDREAAGALRIEDLLDRAPPA